MTFLTISEAAIEARMSLGFIKKEIREGRLIVRKAGRRTLILIEEFQAWAKRLPVKTVGTTTGQGGSPTDSHQNGFTEKTTSYRG